MPEQSTLAGAAAALSERIRTDGGGLTPEFESGAEVGTEAPAVGADEATGAAEQPVQDVTAGAETEGQEAATDDGTGTAEPERFELPQDFNELAPLLGRELDDLYAMRLRLKVDDETGKAYSIEELKELATRPARDDYQRHLEQEQRRAQEAELARHREAAVAREREAEMLASMAMRDVATQEQQLTQAYQQLLQDRAREQADPAGYAIELQRYSAAIQQAQQHRQGIHERLRQGQQKRDQERQERLAEAQKAGRQRLRQMVPEWSDDDAFNKGSDDLSAYVLDARFGTTPEELANLADPRVLYWAEMARRYESLMERTKSAPKPAPTAKLAPGPQAVQLPRGRRSELEAQERLGKSHRLEDAQAVLKHRIGQLSR